jgi:hypothetical protein
MGYGYKVPANQLRYANMYGLLGSMQYGLYGVCVRRESTVSGFKTGAAKSHPNLAKWALSELDHAIFKLAIATVLYRTGPDGDFCRPTGTSTVQYCNRTGIAVTIGTWRQYSLVVRTSSAGLIGAHSFLLPWLNECR